MHKLGIKYGYYNFKNPITTYNINVICQAVTDLWNDYPVIMYYPLI